MQVMISNESEERDEFRSDFSMIVPSEAAKEIGQKSEDR
jgi:hypothetical protein